MFSVTKSVFTSLSVKRAPRSQMKVYNGTNPNRPLPSYAQQINTSKSPYGPKWHPSTRPYITPPLKYEMLQIEDPFNNGGTISTFLYGYFTIYLWCYIPTGVCLVGQSTQRKLWAKDKYSGYARIAQYFDDTTLRTSIRRSTEFFYYYGFSNILLIVLRIDPSTTTFEQVSQMEQYFIDHLYSGLNTQRNVLNANKNSAIINAKQSLLAQASGKSKPV